MWSIIGHAAPLAGLEHAIASGAPAHAWLFAGPQGLGKHATALEFAAALNCTGQAAPCASCRPCLDTLGGRHPDVELITPGGICDEPDHKDHSDSRMVRICQVRRLERVLSLAAYNGGRRVAIVDAADTLLAEAANAFLKTLEEPPPGSIIVLIAERPERLPETVLSRCVRLDFRPVERDTLVEVLHSRGADRPAAEALASAAAGRIGWGLRALEDPSLLEERQRMLDDAMRLAHAGRVARFAWARQAQGRGSDDARERYLRELLVWETWWRDVLLYSAGAQEGAINQDRATVLSQEGKMYEPAEIVAFLQSLLKTRELMQANVDPQLALENLTLDMPRPVTSNK